MIALGLLIVALCAIGTGYLLLSVLLGQRRAGDPDLVTLGDAGLAGLWLMAISGALLHLFLPLGGWTTMLLPAAGAAGFWVHRQRVRNAVEGLWQDRVAVFAGALVLAAAVMTMRFKGAGFYDTGLYHLQQLLMQADGPIILGAANIHMRFGYNSFLYVISGMAYLPGFGLSSALTINPILLVFVVLALVQHGRAAPATRLPAIAGWLVLGLGILAFARGWVASPLSDIAAALLVAYASFMTLRLLLSPAASATKAVLFVLITLSSALAVAVKLSALPVLGMILVAGIAVQNGRARWSRPVVGSLAAATLLGLVWAGRGVLLSGCLGYPAAATCLPLPWTIPTAVAEADLAAMKHYARIPGGSPDLSSEGWVWLSGWLDNAMPWILVLPLVLGLLAALGRRHGWRMNATAAPVSAANRGLVMALLGVLCGGVLFWFLSAPLWRYGFCFLIPLLAIAAGLLSPVADGRRGRALTPRRWVSPVVPLVLLIIGEGVGMAGLGKSWPVARQNPIVPVQSRHGTTMFQPQGDDRCWAAPRPCSPMLDPHLRLTRIALWTAAIHDPS